MRFIGPGVVWSRDEAEDVARAQCDHWRRHGFGWRAAVEKATREVVGFGALNFVGEGTVGLEHSDVEIGWWLDPAVWGRGLACEAGAAMRDEAFTRLGAPRIVARIQPENAASVAVATAIGLTLDSQTRGRAGELLHVYRQTADEWRSARVEGSTVGETPSSPRLVDCRHVFGHRREAHSQSERRNLLLAWTSRPSFRRFPCDALSLLLLAVDQQP
jgi:RimJ/RimL family protein N-acetyltransferase